MASRIGLLGGSFNPAHRAHRRMSLAAMEALGLDEVWWLVSPGNPLKDGAKDMAPYAARLASARAWPVAAAYGSAISKRRRDALHGGYGRPFAPPLARGTVSSG